MASAAQHAALGALAGLAPDAVLAAFVWRKTWLPHDHPLMRAHRFIHGPGGFAVAAALGFAVHVVADRYTEHNLAPGVRGKRGWRW